MPLVSVVMPTRNRARILPRAVASVLEQTHADLELIVIDDASTDDTLAQLDSFDDRRLSVVANTRNTGQAAARNRGIAAASGDWIAFLDDDDEWLPRKLERQLERAAVTGATVVYSPYLLGLGDRVLDHTIPLPEGDVFATAIAGWNPPLTSTLMVRSGSIGDGYDEGLVGVEDYDLLLRLAQTDTFACEPTSLAIVDKTPSLARHTFQLSTRLAAIDRLGAKWEERVDDVRLLDRLTHTLADLRLVAQITVGLPDPDSGRGRLGLLAMTWQAAIPRRTKLAGLLRVACGATAAATVQRTLFRVRGHERASVRGV